jgi:ABC-2 type transport system permease protein
MEVIAMSSAVFRKTLRDYWVSTLVWGGGIGALLAYYAWAYVDLFKGPNRAELLAEYQKAFDTFAFIAGKAADIDTFGGFLTAEFMAYLPILLGIFGLMAGSALIRKEEERGSLDLLLAAPLSRVSVILQKWAGLLVSLLAAYALCFAGMVIGAAFNKLELDSSAVALACLNGVALSLCYATLALALSQFTSRKAAAGWTGGLLAAGYLMSTLGGAIKSLEWLQPLTPFYYYSLSKPMSRSIGMDWGGFTVIALLFVPFLVGATLVYRQRDHNATARLFGGFKQAENETQTGDPRSIWLKGGFLFELRRSLPGALIWGSGIALYIVFILPYLNEVRSSMSGLLQSDFYKVLGFSNLTSNESLLSMMLFLFLLALVAAYSVIQVAGWVSDETEGRLELLLAAPSSRWRRLINRFVVALISVTLIIGLCALTFYVVGWLAGTTVDAAKLTGAFAGLWVIAVITIGTGIGLAGVIPDKTVAILSGLVVISFLVELLREALKLPGWLLDLSVFHQYGQPLLNGLDWRPMLIILGLGVIFTLAGGLRFYRRDILK